MELKNLFFIKNFILAAAFAASLFHPLNLLAATEEIWDGVFTITSPELCADNTGTWQNILTVSDAGKISGQFTDSENETGSVTGNKSAGSFNFDVTSAGAVIVRTNGIISGTTASGNFNAVAECYPGSGPTSGTLTAQIKGQIIPPPAPPTPPQTPAAEPAVPVVTEQPAVPDATPTPIPLPAAPAEIPQLTFEERFTGFVRALQANPQAVQLAQKVALPVTVTMGAATAGALTVTVAQGSASVAFNLSNFFRMLSLARFYLLAFLRFEKKRAWGRVVDRFNNLPIAGAIVEIYNADYDKMRDKQMTDAAGRFSGLVGIGAYYVTAEQKGYQEARSSDVEITSPQQLLNLEIALSPDENFNQAYVARMNIFNAAKHFLDKLSPLLLAIGILSALIVAIIIPTALNYALLAVYLFLGGLKIYLSRHIVKSYGSITDAETGEPLPLVVLRIFDWKRNWLLATKVSDTLGRYDFMLLPGAYYVTCAKTGFAPARSEAFSIKDIDSPLPHLTMKQIANLGYIAKN